MDIFSHLSTCVCTQSPKYLEMAQGHISLSGPSADGCGGRGSPTSTCGGGGSQAGGGPRSRGRATTVPLYGGGGSQAGGRNSITSTRGGGGSSIRSSGGGPRSRGRATAGPLCGQAAASPKPRGGGTSKAGEQATPVDVRATATHEARCSSEQRHGRREMRAAMIARDIL
jgi:hypothetical protein